ncbi:MAG: hypothetical protein KDD94_15210, partial [Calditrichaeota bacterium]|nr:hypothetical protein [Calditrichota bacterium]
DGRAISSFHIPSGPSIRLLSQEPGYKIGYFDYHANSRLLIVSRYNTKKADVPTTGYVAELYRLTESGLVKINSYTDSQFVFTYPDFSNDGYIYYYGNQQESLFRTDTLFSKFELISDKKIDHFDSF